MQTVGDTIYLLPAWPKNWDVDFKLHAPKNTTITGTVKQGKLMKLEVFPKMRRTNIKVMGNVGRQGK